MGGLPSSPTYLFRQNGIFHFRISVPLDLRQVLGKREVRLSLETGYVSEARRKSLELAAKAWSFFTELREGKMAEYSVEDVQAMLRRYLKKQLEVHNLFHATYPDRSDNLENIQSLRRTLQTANYQDDLAVAGATEEIMEENGIEAEEGTFAYNVIAREVTKTLIDLFQVYEFRFQGDAHSERTYLKEIFAKDQQRVQMPAQDVGVELPEETPEGDKLADVINAYLEKCTLKTRTKKKYSDDLAIFLEVVGDIDMTYIGHKTIRDLVDVLHKLPAHRNKKPEFKDLSINELINMDIEETLNQRTVYNIVGSVSAFFSWCKDQGYMDTNYASGKAPKRAKSAKSNREAYTNDDLIKIFYNDDYKKDKLKHPYMFWMPVLALYTGARQNELAQLALDDFKEYEGVWCIHVNAMGDDKSVKTDAAWRYIPLHDFIVKDLNLVGYVNMLKKRGEVRLFPEIRKKNDSYGQSVSEWYGRFRKRHGIIPSSSELMKDFHSFRKTFLNKCKFSKVDMRMAEELAGHAGDSMSYNYYADDYPATMYYEHVISKLDVGIDLSHLRDSKFVVREAT